MAPRAYWKGHIRLALVSFPVRLYAAVTSSERITLNRIHRESGERVRLQNVVEGHGPVDRDEIVMGYEVDRDEYVPIEEEELDAIEVESKHTIDLSRFVELSDIDPIYFDRPYFVAPDGPIATEAFVTIRDALRGAKKVALGTIVLAKRERIVAIQPCGKGLVLETLRWADEVREADAYFDDIKDVEVSADQVEMAETLIAARTGDFEPETFVDTYQKELRALIERKMAGRRPKKGERGEGAPSNVINLMDALKASLEDDAPPRKSASGSKAKTASRSNAKASASTKGKTKASAGAAKSDTPATRRSRTAKSGSAKGSGTKGARTSSAGKGQRQRKSA